MLALLEVLSVISTVRVTLYYGVCFYFTGYDQP